MAGDVRLDAGNGVGARETATHETSRTAALGAVRRRVVMGDVGALTAASAAAYLGRSAVLPDRAFDAIAVAVAAMIVFALWMIALAVAGSYDVRVLGYGPEESRRAVMASVGVLAGVSTVSYLFSLEPSRGLVLIQLPLGVALVIANRAWQRRWLRRARQYGRYMQMTVVVGDTTRAGALCADLAANPHLGYSVVAVKAPPRDGADLPRWLDDLEGCLRGQHAEAVALTAHSALDRAAVREIGWRLEAPGVDLLVSPDIADIGGPRTTLRHGGALQLIHLDQPQLSGPKRVLKRGLDLALSIPMCVLLLPVVAALAVAVRASSAGPAFYTQPRIGMHGSTFSILKLRTMQQGADAVQAQVWADGRSPGTASKHPRDPRLTPVGRWLRRFSLDEMPQLLNVVRGEMSLVGPRPLQPAEVANRPGHHTRRLLTRPGMTGLWQVSGRSDVSWDARMAMDLRYVETWSITLDLTILARTVVAVVAGRGAY